jgi:3,4-dihydroxy 2-butanone 4-phosphate synthase/GTP cyclohydrolase II
MLLGSTDAAVFMDLLTRDGRLLTAEEQHSLAAAEGIPLIRLSDLVQHRLSSETLVHKVAEAALPTRAGGELRSVVYKSHLHEGEHVALVKGTIDPEVPTLTRVTTEQTFSDVFGGPGRNSRVSIQQALRILDANPAGVLVYLRRPMHGALADQLLDTTPVPGSQNMALMRSYGLGAQILRDLGVRKIALLSNTEQHLLGLDTFGLEIVSQQPLVDSEAPR